MLIIGAIAAYFIALRAATQAYDRALMDPVLALAQHTKLVNGVVVIDLPEAARNILMVDAFDRMYYEVRDHKNRLIAGEQGFPTAPHGLVAEMPNFHETRYRGSKIRVAALRLPIENGDATVQVGETLIKRDKLVWEILLAEIIPATLVAVAAVALVWFGIGRGLRPLDHLRAEIATRSQRDLRSLAEDDTPIEVRPMVRALNNLLQHLRESLDAQQRFLANAAHQLRTPLAGLQTQAELVLRRPIPAELQDALNHMHDAARRATHLANQLLALARAEPGAQLPNAMELADLQTIISSAAIEWVPRAIAKGIDLGFELAPAMATLDPLLVRELLDNIIDNALIYTPKGGTVTVRCRATATSVLLEFEDDGIGIPTELRPKVFERFYRVDASSGEGCGLGLAIVDEIATLHDAEVSIKAPVSGKGTVVCILFPRAV